MDIEPFRLERYFAAHEFTAPHLLCCSDCETLSVEELFDFEPEARERFAALRLGYTESLGSPELREQIASLYREVSQEQILVHAGAEEAIFNFMQVLLEPGDHVVVHSPCYQSLAGVARGIGAVVSEWEADSDNGWALDIEGLEILLTEKTRLLVVNVPHNPTGYLPGPGFLEELSRLSEARGFVVFCDEVYRGLEYDATDRLPAFADIDARGVSLGVMSKTYGLAGLRIGWVATRNRKIYEGLAAFKDYTSICSSAPSEFFAALALRHRRPIVERNRRIVLSNLDRLDAFFSEHTRPFSWQRPKAGPIAFPRLREGSVEDFCRSVLQDAGVLLLPGTLYREGLDGFRVGFGRKDFPEGLARLEEWLRSRNGGA